MKNYTFFGVLIPLIIVFLVTYKILSYGTITGDDIWVTYFFDDLKYELMHIHHGRYLPWIQIKFFGLFIPYMMHMHPQDVFNTLNAFIRAFNVSLLCFVIVSFLYVHRKYTLLTPFVVLFMFLYYLWLILQYNNITELSTLVFHFGYTVGLFLYLCFILLLIFCFKNIDFVKKYRVLVSVFSFLCALNDTFAVIGILTIFYISIFKKKDILQNKYCILPLAFFCLGGIFSIFGVFQDNHVASRLFFYDNGTLVLSSFLDFFFLVKKFIPAFCKFVILNHIYLHVLILVLSIILFFKKMNNVLFFPISLYLGVVSFFILLIVGGDDSFYEKGLFWIAQGDLQLVLQIILMCVSLLLINIVLSLKENCYCKFCYLFFICIIFLLLFVQIDIRNTIRIYIENFKTAKIARIQAYKAEKMYLFYAYKNKIAYLPVGVLAFREIAEGFWVGKNLNEELIANLIFLYQRNANFPDWKDRKYVVSEISKCIFYEDVHYINSYIKNTYQINSLVPFYLIDSKEAYKIFKDNGGVFTKEELQNIEFKKLYDKNFVLNIK